jgi:hypothetical protein
VNGTLKTNVNRTLALQGYHRMFVIAKSAYAIDTEMIENHLIRILPLLHRATKTGKWIRFANVLKGGNGRMREFRPPYFAYITVKFCGSEDQLCSTGLQ